MRDEPMMLPRLLLALLVLAWPFAGATPARAQEARVKTQLSAGVVKLGGQARILIVVEDARDAEIERVPQVEGLELGRPRGPSSESGMSWVNGRRTTWHRMRWEVSVRPTREGDFEIPPIELLADGKVMRTRSLNLRVVRDLSGEELGFLEIRPSAERVVEGQPFSVELRFGWDREAEVNYADLALPWWGELPGAVELEDRGFGPGATTVEGVKVNGRVSVVAEEAEQTVRDGRRYRTLRLVRTFLPGRPGTITFPQSFLEFGRLDQSRSIFARTASKRASYFVPSDEFSVEVVPLPAEGQPFDFSGAVGTLSARASVDTRDVVVGDSIKLTVDWTGQGNLEFFEPPDLELLDDFHGFRLYGRTEEKSFERRRVTYDIAPVSPDTGEIPPVPLSVYDPDESAYTTVLTEPIPIRVRALEGEVRLADDSERFARDIHDIDTRPLEAAGTGSSSVERGPPDEALLAGLFLVPFAWLVGRTAVRKRRGDPDAPLARRARRARRDLRRDLAAAGTQEEELKAFAAFLGARTRESDVVWMGRSDCEWSELAPELEPDVDEARGHAAIELLQRLEGAVYGGGPRVPREEILAVADLWTKKATGGAR